MPAEPWLTPLPHSPTLITSPSTESALEEPEAEPALHDWAFAPASPVGAVLAEMARAGGGWADVGLSREVEARAEGQSELLSAEGRPLGLQGWGGCKISGSLYSHVNSMSLTPVGGKEELCKAVTFEGLFALWSSPTCPSRHTVSDASRNGTSLYSLKILSTLESTAQMQLLPEAGPESPKAARCLPSPCPGAGGASSR